MTHIFYYPVSADDAGRSVEAFLLSLGYSRHLLIALKQTEDGLCIDGEKVYTTRRLQSGETLTVTLPTEKASAKIVETPMDLDIVYEDEDLLVINKASDTPIHPSQGNFTNTLANGMAWYFAQKGEPFVYRVINRLDRDTTGLLILAKHGLSACILSQMVRSHTITRTYLAAVCGDIRLLSHPDCPDQLPRGIFLSEKEGSGTITAPIARVCDSTIEREVNFTTGEYACTHYEQLSFRKETNTSLVQLQLETGRTHQIRVHMKYAGFPLYGDFLYYPDFRYINRQSLHSWKLQLLHPITKKPLAFTAAVPADMKQFL